MVKLNKIYTSTGDDGTTGLVGGARVSKASARMAAIGDVDEANSMIGVAIATIRKHEFLREASPQNLRLAEHLQRIQNELFDLGADLATPGEVEGALRITSGQVERLEALIDELNTHLDPLTSFVLPGGERGGADLYLARAVVRRAERSAVAIAEPLNPHALTYLNRLSDFLFVAARFVNKYLDGDVLWVPGASR